MLLYDLTAEYISLLMISILIVSLAWNKETASLRLKMFTWMYIACFSSILTTIITTLTSQYFTFFPVWFLEAIKVLYYILAPSVSLFTFLYTVALTEISANSKITNKTWIKCLIPYAIYILIILSNYIYPSIFYFSDEVGYCRGPLFQITYVVAAIYIIWIYILTIKNRKTVNKNITLILCINVTIATIISSIQFIMPHILLAGLASVTGVMIVFVYVQNSKAVSDKLTGLFNRQSLMYYIEKMARNNSDFSLFLFSLQNFKGINERYGLALGDAILITIGQLFSKTFNKEIVFRYSGDEFALVATNINDDFENRITTVIERFKENFVIQNKEIKISLVYTRVDYPYFSTNVKTLVSTADYAISQLKDKSYENNYLYDFSICSEMQRVTNVIEFLKHAIENDGFDVHYQPIFSFKTGHFSQAEALIRLKDGAKHSLYPSEFIPIAEKSGLIIKITYLVLDKVCKDLRKMLDEKTNTELKSISINFPYKIFFQTDMYDNVMNILNTYNIMPEQIRIEITERSLISDDSTVKSVISTMKDKGFIFELDDFGVEYSNMSVFLKLPINYLKIDKSLVDVSVENKECRPFFQNLVRGIHSLGKSIIVEGVEDNEQLDFIKQCGCEYIQGYVFSRPLPLNELEAFLKKQL